MHNFQTGKTLHKTQKTRPLLAGFVCVASDPVLPAKDGSGRTLIQGANGTYYATVNEDGFHYQP
jgi:hypothetical protein